MFVKRRWNLSIPNGSQGVVLLIIMAVLCASCTRSNSQSNQEQGGEMAPPPSASDLPLPPASPPPDAPPSQESIEDSLRDNMIAEWKAFRNDTDYKLKGKKVTWTVCITYVPDDPYSNIEGHLIKPYSMFDVIILGKNDHPYNSSYVMNELPRVRKGDKITVTGTFGGVGSDGSVNIKALKVVNHGVE